MFLIVGLGNPGSRYLLTRHNIGFMALDNLIKGFGNLPAREEHKSITCKAKLDGQDVLFVKPQTFMNLSGEAVQSLLSFYKIDIQNMLVIHDDIDQPYGGIKFQKNRGAGGHNGIKSISELLGTQDYARLKLGVGRPLVPEMDVASYVLQNFSAEENKTLVDFLNIAGDAIESFIFDGIEASSGTFNRKHFSEVQGSR